MKKFNIKNIIWYLFDGFIFTAIVLCAILLEPSHFKISAVHGKDVFNTIRAILPIVWIAKIYVDRRINGKIDKIWNHIKEKKNE